MGLVAVGAGQIFSTEVFIGLTVACMAIFGWRNGLFIATLAGFQVLVAFVVAFSFAGVAIEALRASEVILPARSLALAYVVLFLACVVVTRLAIGAYVPDMAVPLPPWIDTAGALLVGAMAGYMLAGCVCVAWSLASLSGGYRFSCAASQLEPGAWIIGTFARCVESEPSRVSVLLQGNVQGPPPPESPRCSEPFVDRDADGVHDEDEPFGDVDGDGNFTVCLGFQDTHHDRRRRLGLLECYRLGDWERITVAHAPEITSSDREQLVSPPVPPDKLYTATASDADGMAGATYSLRDVEHTVRPNAAEQLTVRELKIDSATGVVSLNAEIVDKRVRKAAFTVLVTDSTGLVGQRSVLITW